MLLFRGLFSRRIQSRYSSGRYRDYLRSNSVSSKTNKSHRYSKDGFGIREWLLSKRLGKSIHEALFEQVFRNKSMFHSAFQQNLDGRDPPSVDSLSILSIL